MLLDLLFDSRFGESHGDIPLDLDTHLSDVGDCFTRGLENIVDSFLQILLAIDREYNLSNRVDCGNLEVETRVLR